MTINWHLEKDCNYKCTFCFANFANVTKNMSTEDARVLMRMIKDAGIYKVNFAGGEPLLHPSIGEYVRYAKELGMRVSLITNGSLVRKTWLCAYGQFIDQIGISCDSVNEHTNKLIGRGYGAHVHTTTRLLKWIHEFNETQDLDIQIKINTVVMSVNHLDDWCSFMEEYAPLRWKVLKILHIKGENCENYDQLAISDEQFEAFVHRHSKLIEKRVTLVPENNDDMTSSYIMMTPDGKFYQNCNNAEYMYSQPVLNVGVENALQQVGFDYNKFVKRGGPTFLNIMFREDGTHTWKILATVLVSSQFQSGDLDVKHMLQARLGGSTLKFAMSIQNPDGAPYISSTFDATLIVYYQSEENP